jgi:hypothetical protein
VLFTRYLIKLEQELSFDEKKAARSIYTVVSPRKNTELKRKKH